VAEPRAILFDLDGVILDSEVLHHRAYERALAPFGISRIPFDVYAEHWSSRGQGIAFAVRTWNVDPERLKRDKEARFRELLEREAELRRGAAQAVRRLAARWPLAVATGSPRDAAEFALRRFGLRAHFLVVVGREDYRQEKPAPDAFLRAAEGLGVAPGECVAIEDSWKGVAAAAAGGIPCIAIPNEYTRRGDFSRAALVLDEMSGLDEAAVLRAFSVVRDRADS
jgi:HAD superfamily hydrolase (TIGR01509 family)